MPAAKYKKVTEAKLLSRFKVSTTPLFGFGRGRWLVEHRRLVVALREVRDLLRFRREGPARELQGRKFSRAVPYMLDHLRRGGDYLPAYRDLIRLSVACQDRGWDAHAKALELSATWVASKRGGDPRVRRSPAAAPPPGMKMPSFLLDDLDPKLEDALLDDPKQREHDAMIAHIRLNRDPEELVYAPLLERQKLAEALLYIRDALELSRPEAARLHGLSRSTWERLETLDGRGSYLPHISTLRKLAALCRELGWMGQAEVLEQAAGWDRRHRYPERKDTRGY